MEDLVQECEHQENEKTALLSDIEAIRREKDEIVEEDHMRMARQAEIVANLDAQVLGLIDEANTV